MEKNEYETKIGKVLDHLQTNLTITSWEAITKYRATRLSDIIFRLKQRGWSITTEMVQKEKERYAVYHFGGRNVLSDGSQVK